MFEYYLSFIEVLLGGVSSNVDIDLWIDIDFSGIKVKKLNMLDEFSNWLVSSMCLDGLIDLLVNNLEKVIIVYQQLDVQV